MPDPWGGVQEPDPLILALNDRAAQLVEQNDELRALCRRQRRIIHRLLMARTRYLSKHTRFIGRYM